MRNCRVGCKYAPTAYQGPISKGLSHAALIKYEKVIFPLTVHSSELSDAVS